MSIRNVRVPTLKNVHQIDLERRRDARRIDTWHWSILCWMLAENKLSTSCWEVNPINTCRRWCLRAIYFSCLHTQHYSIWQKMCFSNQFTYFGVSPLFLIKELRSRRTLDSIHIRLILLLMYPDGHSDLASLMPKRQLSINIPVD